MGRASTDSAWVRFRRSAPWRYGRYVGGILLAALILWVLAERRTELSGASSYFSRIDTGWLLLAVGAEVVSLMAFAIMQRRLLAIGRVDAPIMSMTAMTLAATAIANSLPAGAVVSSVFSFRQYRSRGADDALAAWVLVAVLVVTSVSLALVAAFGLAVAGTEGADLDLVWVTAGVLVGALALGALFVEQRFLAKGIIVVSTVGLRLVHRGGRGMEEKVASAVERVTSVSLSARQMAVVTGWGVANWLLDCSCLALCFLAVDTAVPWKGLLLAYGAGQLAANLPITPGGLGVVEGSLTIALVAYGGAEASTVAAVLLYRVISFWGELPVGWLAWGGITYFGRRNPVAMESPGFVGAGKPTIERSARWGEGAANPGEPVLQPSPIAGRGYPDQELPGTDAPS